jgi:hypothetical protein
MRNLTLWIATLTLALACGCYSWDEVEESNWPDLEDDDADDDDTDDDDAGDDDAGDDDAGDDDAGDDDAGDDDTAGDDDDSTPQGFGCNNFCSMVDSAGCIDWAGSGLDCMDFCTNYLGQVHMQCLEGCPEHPQDDGCECVWTCLDEFLVE